MSKVVIVVGEDFEDSEFSVPFERLKAAGHSVTLMGTEVGETVHSKRGKTEAKIEQTAEKAYPDDFDALVVPGGYSPDHLRLDPDIVNFTRGFVETGKPVAAICHGPQLLIEAEAVKGRRLTSWPSVRKDLINAGASWVDEQVVEDENLITSRKPEDLEAFCNSLLQKLQGTRH